MLVTSSRTPLPVSDLDTHRSSELLKDFGDQLTHERAAGPIQVQIAALAGMLHQQVYPLSVVT